MRVPVEKMQATGVFGLDNKDGNPRMTKANQPAPNDNAVGNTWVREIVEALRTDYYQSIVALSSVVQVMQKLLAR